jgi:hypothetical protein
MHIALTARPSPLLLALAAAYPGLATAAAAARIDFAVGNVVALGTAGNSRPLSKGAEVQPGETVSTRDGRAQLRFSDGSLVSLQPQSDFRVDSYRYAGQADGSEQGFFSLLKGGMRTITGLIGRTNKDNYRVTTNVATIGIRGTEYSITYGDGITVSTGEGQVMVCNGGGCLLLSSGESALVTTPTSQPSRTEARTNLPPAPPSVSPQVFFASGEQRSGNGTPALNSPLLPSGEGYDFHWAGVKSGSPYTTYFGGTNAGFGSDGSLTTVAVGSLNYSAQGNAFYFTDGTIGWGRWSSGVLSGDGPSAQALKDVHYVVGKPTATNDPVFSSSGTSTYNMLGFTMPTSTTGVVGTQAITGQLSVNFSTYQVGVNMTVPIGGKTYVITDTASWSYGAFNSSGFICGGACTNGQLSGFFAGSGASHAGLTYQFLDNLPGTDLGKISGAAVFKK